MGARLLRRRLLFPLRDRARIEARLEAVAELVGRAETRAAMRALLDTVYDLERLCSRLVLGHGNARDMAAIKTSLARLPEMRQLLGGCDSALLGRMAGEFDELADLHALVEAAIPRRAGSRACGRGNLIREGFNEELDRLLSCYSC